MIKVVILNEIDFKIPMIGKNKLNKIYTYILPVPSLMASALENWNRMFDTLACVSMFNVMWLTLFMVLEINVLL